MPNTTSRRHFLRMGVAGAVGSAVGTSSRPAFSAGSSKTAKLVGVTVLPEYTQSEGIDGVLGSLIDRAGANAVTTSPYVMEVADEKTGGREPPIDAGAGGVRLLDRPLFGKRELWVRTAPSFTPELSRYRGLRYQPPKPDDLTRREGARVGDFVKAAKKAGLKVFFQVQAASPPGYRVQFSGLQAEDLPLLSDGSEPGRRVDKNGSLASPHVVDYARAMLADLAQQYPELDGFRVDWPEYPPYFLNALFMDFSEAARSAAGRLGFDFKSMQSDVERVRRKLFGSLRNRDLEMLLEGDSGRYALVRALSATPGLAEMLRFKSALIGELLSAMRSALDDAGARHMQLVPNAFPPPWNLVSGLHYGECLKGCSGVSVKLYAMHWAMMLRFYGDALLEANPGLSEQLLCRVLVRLLDIADDDGLPHLADYHYPEPDEAHPCGSKAVARKIRLAQLDAGADMPVHALAHGYGPPQDFRRRLEAANEASEHGFWVNRYGYLSDEKLGIIREVSSKA